MESLTLSSSRMVDLLWGPLLLTLLIGGGLFLLLYSRFIPFFGFFHAFLILQGKFAEKDKVGQITHFQALSLAMSSTIGVGNIAGVAVAISQGGAGAVFWMWVAALIGMAIKFFSCSLAIMYRGIDSKGEVQGGPMYFIDAGLGKNFRFLSIIFSVAGLVGCLTMFQANQVAEMLDHSLGIERWVTGLLALSLVGTVIFGGLSRIAAIVSRLVPSMCLLYIGCSLVVIFHNYLILPEAIFRIFHEAFSGSAALGGASGIAVMKVVQIGIKRGIYSTEAGVGTAPMAHGAAKTNEPIREGLVAMVGPFIDTIVINSLTALVIITSGIGIQDLGGVSATAQAFEVTLGYPGRILLLLIVILFGFSTMVGYLYYGQKCFSYLFGAENIFYYVIFYLTMILFGARWSSTFVINILDSAFAIMAVPNMLGTLLLAPKVKMACLDYFKRTGLWV